MSISMRLSRGGSKKRPYYKIVVANSRAPRDGKYLEQIGIYNPLLAKDSGERVKINEERAKHWLSVGAQPTDRVARFLDTMGIKERKATVNLKKVSCGTEVSIVQEGIPEVIPAESCYLGWQESLALLAQLVEAEIPG